MPASDTQLARFRAYFNDSSGAIWDETEVDAIFDEAIEIAGSDDERVIMVEARIIGIDRLMMDAAKLVTYKQNSHSESMSDVFKNLKEMRGNLLQERDRLEKSASGGAARIAHTKRVPGRCKDVP